MENRNNENSQEFEEGLNRDKNIILTKSILEGINPSQNGADGQNIMETLDKASSIIEGLTVKREYFKEELLLNIKAVREKYKNDRIFDPLNIDVISAMLDQLKRREEEEKQP